MIDATRHLLRSLLPDVAVEESGNHEQFTFRLPWPQDGDYRFEVDIHGEEEARLSAVRRNAPLDEYFWYHPFDGAGFPSVAALCEQLHRELRIVLMHQTRIIQTRGLMMSTFACEYDAHGGWKSLYSNGVIRWNKGIPEISGNRRVYAAAPLAGLSQQVPDTR